MDQTRFLLTIELGRLAKWLRILGFDAAYNRSNNASAAIIEALRDDRIILTRNRHFPISGVKIIVIGAETISEQLKEVLAILKIDCVSFDLFKRCVVCNEALAPIGKNEVKGLVPEYVFATQEMFTTCPRCKRIYWQGTHWGNVEDVLKGL